MRKFMILVVLFYNTSAQANDLKAEEIEAQLVDQRISWSDANGWMTGQMTLRSDGNAEISVEAPYGGSDAGHWYLNNNQVCTIWLSMRPSFTKCYSIREIEPGHFITSGGNQFFIQNVGV